MDFVKQFKNARRVGTPFVAIRTFDDKSAISLCTSEDVLGKDKDSVPVILHDIMNGFKAKNKAAHDIVQSLVSDSPQATAATDEALRRLAGIQAEDSLVFFKNAHMFWNEPTVIQGVSNIRDAFKTNGNMLVLLCSPGANLPAELQHDVMMLEEPLPTAEELESIIEKNFQATKDSKTGKPYPIPNKEVIEQAKQALIGLPAFPAEQATAMEIDTSTSSPTYKQLNVTELWERKRQIVGQTNGLSIYKGPESLKESGGCENVTGFLLKAVQHANVILFMDEVEKTFAGTGTDLSGVKTELTGSMLSWTQDHEIDWLNEIGVPGCNKSALAKAIANHFNKPLIIFDLAGMQSGIIGSSGANLRTAQKTAEAVSDNKMLIISTCNDDSALPPELKRRMNLGTFFFDAPNASERPLIWKIYRTKYGIDPKESQPDDSLYTGAEIKECCRKAHKLGMTLKESASYIVPVLRRDAERIRNLRMHCSGKYISASKSGIYEYKPNEKEILPFTEETTSRRIRNEES